MTVTGRNGSLNKINYQKEFIIMDATSGHYEIRVILKVIVIIIIWATLSKVFSRRKCLKNNVKFLCLA